MDDVFTVPVLKNRVFIEGVFTRVAVIELVIIALVLIVLALDNPI